MTANLATGGPDVIPIREGWRVRRTDGTSRTVLKRLNNEDDGWAVFSGTSTHALREPALGYPGSWKQTVEAAIDWARTTTIPDKEQ